MFEPRDLIPDEQEYPEQNQHLQASYYIPATDKASLQRIRSRLLERRYVPTTEKIPSLSELQLVPDRMESNPEHEIIASRQYRLSSQSYHARRKHLWRLTAIVAVVLSLFSGSAFVYSHALLLRPNFQQATPTAWVPSTNAPVSPHGIPPLIASFHMVSATTGWAVANDGVNRSNVLIRTTDGANTWQNINVPYSIDKGFFLDEQTAWVFSASEDPFTKSVLRTIDGGKSWEKFVIPSGITDLFFVDKDNGWAWNPVQINKAPIPLFHTSDGGKSWQIISSSSPDRAIDDPASGPLPSGSLNFTFINAQKGWCIRYKTDNVSPSYATLYMTTDGGKNWQYQAPPQTPETFSNTPQMKSQAVGVINKPVFFDEQHGYLDILVPKTSNNVLAYTYKTDDGGSNWQLAGNVITIDDYFNMDIVTYWIDATHFVVANRSSVNVYQLIEQQWQLQSTLPIYPEYELSKGSVNNLGFVDSDHGWFTYLEADTGHTKLYSTQDGGKSWQIHGK